MKVFKMITLSLTAAAVLTGCSFGTSIDNLMIPPKLSLEQEQIYSALTDAAGTSISLKYPKSGKYLSAFIVEDIDGDGGNEAIVFYEKNSLSAPENTLRINVLDKENDKWRSVCDTPAEGTEIEKVMISELGENKRINLIIGSSLINRSEKNAAIYTYDSSDGTIEQTFSEACSFIDVTDLNDDGKNEFLLLTASSSGGPAEAETYVLDKKGKYHLYSCELSGSFTEFTNLSYGKIGGDRHGLYIDAACGAGSTQTDIIYMDSAGLNKVFNTPEESQATVRAVGCTSLDIDGDGILEIPVQTIAPGYEELPEGEQIMLTQWYVVSPTNRLEQKYLSYYSLNDGYMFIFPKKWQNNITIQRDQVNEEIVFCAFDEGKTARELLRIYCAEDSASRDDRISGGYMLMGTKGDSSYLAMIPQPENEENDEMLLTAGDAAVGFRNF